MKKLLLKLKVLQEISNTKRFKDGKKKLGQLNIAKRINPYNPLSYVVIIIVALVCFFMLGLSGLRKEFGAKNPFKWS